MSAAANDLMRVLLTRPWTPRAVRRCVLCGGPLPAGKVGRGSRVALYCDRIECRREVSRESSRRDYQRHPARYQAHAAAATARALATEAGRERVRGYKRRSKRRRIGTPAARIEQLDLGRAVGLAVAAVALTTGGKP